MSESWRNFQLAFYLLILALFFFLLSRVGLTKPLQAAFDFATVPVQQVVYTSFNRLGKEAAFFWELRTVLGKYYALEKQYGTALTNSAKLTQLAKENEILTRQFAQSSNNSLKLLPAKVIGVSRYLLIAKGANDGVKLGQVVVLENSLIGRVISVSATSARVLLPTDPDSKITAFVQRAERGPRGVVVGAFGSAMNLDKILPEEKIEVGDLLLTTGEVEGDFGHLYPRNLLIGKIAKVNKSDSDLFQTAEVTPVFNYHDLDLVFVQLD